MGQMRLNNYLNYKTTLYRDVRGKIRYYKIKTYLTLFGDYLIVREYGAIKNARPTRIIKKYFSHIEDVFLYINEIVANKKKRGYLYEI